MELLGATVASVDESAASLLELPKASGLVVRAVAAGSPAEAAGLKKLDVLLRADDVDLNDVGKLLAAIAAKRGSTIQLAIWRDGGTLQTTLDPQAARRNVAREATRPPSEEAPAPIPGGAPPPALPPTTDLGEAARRAQQAVVLFVSPRGHGSGFVISRQHRLVATNAHVADMWRHAGDMQAIINETGDRHEVAQVWYHPGVLRAIDRDQVGIVRSADPAHGDTFPLCPDLAVLRLSDDGTPLPAELNLAEPKELDDLLGRAIGLLGFPGSDTKLTPDDLARPQASYQQGVVSRITDFQFKSSTPGNRRQFVQHTALGVHGASGSPVFIANGHVVAVHNSMRNEQSSTLVAQSSYGIRVDCLWELLAYHKLDERLPLPVSSASLDVARFDRPDAEFAKFQRIWSLIFEANRLVRWQRFSEAADRCKEAIALAPDYPYGYGARQEVYTEYLTRHHQQISPQQREEQSRYALEDAERFVKLLPTSSMAALKYALSLNNFGAIAAQRANNDAVGRSYFIDAIAICTELLTTGTMTPIETADAYSTRAVARVGLRQFDEALADANEAIRLAPNAAAAFLNRARVYDARGDARRAQADRAAAAELDRQAAAAAG